MGMFHLPKMFFQGSLLYSVYSSSHLSDRIIIFGLELRLLAFAQ